MTGGAVSGPVILGGAGPEHFLDRGRGRRLWQRWPWPTAGSRRAGCARACSRCRSPGCPPRSTACGSRTSPTSTSARPRAGRVAVRRAADWVREREPDLVVVTGDLLSHPRGRAGLDEALRGLDAYVVLGNHDVAVTRDPFSRPAELDGLAATLLAGRVGHRRPARRADPARGHRAASRRGAAASRSLGGPAHPAQPLSAAARPGLSARARRPHARGPDRAPVPRRQDPLRASPLPADRGPLPRGRRRRCTSRPASARPSCPSGSSRGPR